MTNKKAGIIIVNWNGKRFLENCLSSVFAQTYKPFEVYFVDNGSTDESSQYVREAFPKANVVQLDRNYGFAKGNNEGIREAFKDKGLEYIVCLNNDTIVDKDWLKELVKTAEKDEKIGQIQSKVLFGDRKTIHSAGAILLPDFASESRGFKEKDIGQFDKEEEIEMAIGCSFLIKRKVLEKIGLFEERFFSYKEDDDLSLRTKLSGYKVYYSPKSIVYHLHSSTFGAKSPKKLFYNERNRLLNLITYGSFSQIFSSPLYTMKRYLGAKKESDDSKSNKGPLLVALTKAWISAAYYTPVFLIKRAKITK